MTQAATAHAAPRSAEQTKLSSSAADELRKTVRRALGQLFQTFLQQLPEALVVSAQNLASDSARDGFRDLARAVPANEQRWLDTFIRQVDGHLIGDVKASRDEASQPTTEESFVLANLELRAEELHQDLITQLDARLERVRQNVYIPIHVKALAPAGLCRALQDTADQLQWPASQRQILFEKFDDLVVNELQLLYRSLLDALSRINTVVTRTASAAPDSPAAARPPPAPAPASAPMSAPQARVATPTPPPAPMATPAPAPAPETTPPIKMVEMPAPKHKPQAKKAPAPPLPKAPEALPNLRIPFDAKRPDANTMSMLESVASNDTGTVYSDGTLASELLAISKEIPVPDLAPEQIHVPRQRLNLAGHFLSEAIADPFIPAELKQQHESMRFPLVKSAIADETFFTAVTHPLRSLVNEMMLKSATSRVTGSSETRRIADMLQQVLVQFDLAPSFVREAMLTAKPLGDEQMKAFETMQRQQAAQRRDSVINEAKRIVAHEIEQATFSISIPEQVITFINKGWGPVLVKRLLQGGSAHALWKDGLAMMQALVDQLEERDPEQPPSGEWKALLQQFVQGLTAAGVAVERVHEYINNLEAARRTPLFEV